MFPLLGFASTDQIRRSIPIGPDDTMVEQIELSSLSRTLKGIIKRSFLQKRIECIMTYALIRELMLN